MRLAWTVSTAIKNGYRFVKTRISSAMVDDTKTANPFGFDSSPTKNYIAILTQTSSNEEPVIVGYLNPRTPELNVGDSIMYATDEDGNITTKVILRGEGDIEISTETDINITVTGNVNVTAKQVNINNGNLTIDE